MSHLDADPTDFEGNVPPPRHPRDDDSPRKKPKNNAATGASAAGIRAISAQLVAFYFRAPAKAFFRTRIDIGAVLYTSYLQFLGLLHPPSSQSLKRTYPPPPFSTAFTAGFLAGTVQSVAAAPLDALQVRFKVSEMLEGQYRSMWHYGRHKLYEIGLRGVFAGWSITFLRESVGCGVFFATFEFVKQQAYYSFVTHYYRPSRPPGAPAPTKPMLVTPHFALEPTFLLLAGLLSTLVQQTIVHPLTLLQTLHHTRLESLDYAAKLSRTRTQILRVYYHAYEKTLAQARKQARVAGGWRTWLYRGFWGSALRQVPSTSAGLIVFELVRRRYGSEDGEGRIAERDGVDIVLS
ncbi:MAG: hypothetical protein M1833_006167 [Piccolia ochrophora]|nr:MAG: hypothetical protein M1833_006167 [Piccolia ochrophora]